MPLLWKQKIPLENKHKMICNLYNNNATSKLKKGGGGLDPLDPYPGSAPGICKPERGGGDRKERRGGGQRGRGERRTAYFVCSVLSLLNVFQPYFHSLHLRLLDHYI